MNEEELITAIRSQGCSDATKQLGFTSLFNHLEPKVKGYACYLLHRGPTDTIVNDIVALSMEKMFLKINSYKEEYSLWGWVSRITLNTVRDYYRKRKRASLENAVYDEESSSVRNLTDSSGTADSRIICRENIRQVKNYVATLPEKHRKVLELRFFSDQTYNQISSRLNLNIRTVSTIILRCRLRLKKRMQL